MPEEKKTDKPNKPTAAAHSERPEGLMPTLEYYLVTKAPYTLSPKVREWIVKYGPWIDVVILILLAPAILLTLGVGAVVLPLSAVAGPAAAHGLGLALVALVAQVGLMVLALPGLFARKKAGWNLTFYGVVFSLVYSVLNLNIIGGVVSAVLSSYVLFQVRSYYK